MQKKVSVQTSTYFHQRICGSTRQAPIGHDRIANLPPHPILVVPSDPRPRSLSIFFTHRLVIKETPCGPAHASQARPEQATLSSTSRGRRQSSTAQAQQPNGHHQRRRGDHRRRPCLDRQAAGPRSAPAEGEGREGEVQLLQGRPGGDPGRRPRGRRVPARRGGRGDRVRGAGAGAGRRADVHGGHRAEPGAQQQPAGVDPPGRLRPHLVALHRLHLRPRRGRGVRRPLALSRARSSLLAAPCNPPASIP